MQPIDVPANCPRVGSSPDPVRCAITECRYHCATPGLRGPVSGRLRLRIAGDDCALAIAARGELTQAQISKKIGVSMQAVHILENKAMRKLKEICGESLSKFLDGEWRKR